MAYSSEKKEIPLSEIKHKFTHEIFPPQEGEAGRKNRDNTYLKYVRVLDIFLSISEQKGMNLDEVTTLDLPPTIYNEFGGWLRNSYYEKDGTHKDALPVYIEENIELVNEPTKFSEATVQHYLTCFRAILVKFMGFRYLGFSKAEMDEAIKMVSRRRKNAAYSHTQNILDIPGDYAKKMIQAAFQTPIPVWNKEGEVEKPSFRVAKLNLLRQRALVLTLSSTALRAGDITKLDRNHLLEASDSNSGSFSFVMQKTGKLAYACFTNDVQKAIIEYLEYRRDSSPYLFIQHGGYGRGNEDKTPEWFRDPSTNRGYGLKLSANSVWRIIQGVIELTDFSEEEKKKFGHPHVFRHWHARQLIQQGLDLGEVQSVLGHATPTTTKNIYAPTPNVKNIRSAQNAILGNLVEKEED